MLVRRLRALLVNAPPVALIDKVFRTLPNWTLKECSFFLLFYFAHTTRVWRVASRTFPVREFQTTVRLPVHVRCAYACARSGLRW